MTSPMLSTNFLRVGAAALLAATALSACSTMKSISPFTSNVPYSQEIQPTLPRPAQPEIPAFKPAPKPVPKVEVSEQPASPPSAPPASEPATAPATTPAPAPSAPPPATPEPAPAAPPSPPPAPQSSAPEAAPAPKTATVPAPEKTASAETQSGAGADTENLPQLPAEHREFKDDGSYPNLAQVPARPVNLPTFAEAKKVENALLADNEKQKAASPESPAAPSVDSTPEKATAAPPPAPEAPVTIAAGLPRPEDKSPCLSTNPGSGAPTATVHFALGSSSMTSDNLQVLAEVMPNIRGAKGSVRLFGHGDTDANAPQGAGRFELAAARAGAVAQALAGFGIPAPKIAVGVACRDAATSGASVQLYAES